MRLAGRCRPQKATGKPGTKATFSRPNQLQANQAGGLAGPRAGKATPWRPRMPASNATASPGDNATVCPGLDQAACPGRNQAGDQAAGPARYRPQSRGWKLPGKATGKEGPWRQESAPGHRAGMV